ncbi:MAG: metalloregulator ArsR/SmtB family transcription factor [Phycisphaerales bacterium]|jgi:DNA-binding transcriptional ArsR family regulator|nr:metalloregulator ArsR/SmtB family transcription factor [Phycisphaerales bacterium]
MARAPTTTDAFNAVAEPRRRAIIDLLARNGPLAVGAIVAALSLPQPTVSKHLGVLREVGILSVERLGQQRVYRLQPEELKTMFDWLKQYEQFWTHQLDRIKERAERKQREAANTKRNA